MTVHLAFSPEYSECDTGDETVIMPVADTECQINLALNGLESLHIL